MTELVRQAEVRLAAQHPLLLAAIQRGVALSGLMLAAAATMLNVAVSSSDRLPALVPELMVGAAAALVFGALITFFGGSLSKIELVGSGGAEVDGIDSTLALPKAELLRRMLDDYHRRVAANAEFLSRCLRVQFVAAISIVVAVGTIATSIFPADNNVRPPYILDARGGSRVPVPSSECGKLWVVCDEAAWKEHHQKSPKKK
ncbi:MAG: hypothetical protein HY859_12810 [Caulobacterales bacterium]|nr:hypothetical protein [Caulobacterales bacterium]